MYAGAATLKPSCVYGMTIAGDDAGIHLECRHEIPNCGLDSPTSRLDDLLDFVQDSIPLLPVSTAQVGYKL